MNITPPESNFNRGQGNDPRPDAVSSLFAARHRARHRIALPFPRMQLDPTDAGQTLARGVGTASGWLVDQVVWTDSRRT